MRYSPIIKLLRNIPYITPLLKLLNKVLHILLINLESFIKKTLPPYYLGFMIILSYGPYLSYQQLQESMRFRWRFFQDFLTYFIACQFFSFSLFSIKMWTVWFGDFFGTRRFPGCVNSAYRDLGHWAEWLYQIFNYTTGLQTSEPWIFGFKERMLIPTQPDWSWRQILSNQLHWKPCCTPLFIPPLLPILKIQLWSPPSKFRFSFGTISACNPFLLRLL